MTNRYVPAPHHGGSFRSGQPTIIVIHSLEAPARRGLAYDLATGWIQTEEVSPHSMTDPGETVDLLPLSTIGWHCGNGNQVGVGLEVTGYAAWPFETWTSPEPFAAVRLDAKRAAEVAGRFGIPHRWLSLQQIRGGESGFCTHADISATLGGTNHTDPGRGFPFAIFMQMVNQWSGTGSAGSNPPQVSTGTSGGAQHKTPEQIEEEELMSAKDDIIRAVNAHTDQRLKEYFDEIISDVNGSANGVRSFLGWIDGKTWLLQRDMWAVMDHLKLPRSAYPPHAAPKPPPPKPPVVVKPPTPPAPTTYKVAAGDGFDAIAAKLHTTPDKLAAANPAVKNRDVLEIGQVLNIPKA